MDADGWLTKAEAATALGVGERTVERLASRGALTARMRPGFPTVYNPSDVATLASAGRTVHRAAIAPAGQAGNGHGALARRDDASTDQFLERVVRFLDAVGERLALGPTGPTGPTAPTLFVGLAEASAIAGLSPSCLRRLIKAGTLPARRDRGLKIRRRDLEGL